MKKDQEGIGELDREEGVEDLEIEWGPKLEMEERGFYQTFFLENADKHRESDWFLRESEGGAFSQTVAVSVIDDIVNS